MRRHVTRHRRGTTGNRSSSSSIYFGFRMDGGFYFTCYGSPNSADFPFAGADASGAVLDMIRAHAGKNPTAVQYGGNDSAWPPVTYYTDDAGRVDSAGMFSQYDWGTTVAGLNDLLANNSTAWTNLGQLATQMKAHGRPILFRPLWEMNGGWFSWGRTNFTAAQYVTIWRNTWQIFADVMSGSGAGAGDGTHTGNCSFFWCPNILGTGTTADLTDRWPGAAYVDWTGFDGYIGTAHYGTAYLTPEQLYGPTRDAILGLTGASALPMGVGEMGIGADLAAPGKDGFITAMFGGGGWLDQNSRVKYVNYFNDNSAESAPNQSLCFEQTSTACPVGTTAPQSAMATALSRSYFKANIVDTTVFPNGAKVPIPS